MGPRLSVVVRSFNRVAALCELLELLLAQDHPSFEVVVVEQSTTIAPAAARRLAELERDPRLAVLRRPPLGGARARNLGAEHARGDVLVFIDDDDLPEGTDFLSTIERPFLEDLGCLGVTCRHTWGAVTEPTRWYRFLARRRCMRFSSLLRLPSVYARFDRPVDAVDYVHGTGGAYRRSVIERFGGWDEDTPIEDEASLGIRVRRGLAPGERLVFDPRARLQRRMDLDGGLGKRSLGARGFYRKFMTFVHHILGRYYPVRTRLLYPAYVLAGILWTLEWIWADSRDHRSFGRRLAGTLAFLVLAPWCALAMLREPFGRSPGTGVALAARLRAEGSQLAQP